MKNKTNLEKIRELKYNIKQFEWVGSEITKRIVARYKREVKEIREKSENGCGRNCNKIFHCDKITRCSICQEIIKICKEIEG